MPFSILALIWVGALSSCVSHDADALTIEPSHDYGRHIELSPKEQIKEYVCSQLYCPEHLNIDEFKTTGKQFASVKISTRWRF